MPGNEKIAERQQIPLGLCVWLEGEEGGQGLWWHYGHGVVGERVDKPEQIKGIAGSNTEEGLLGRFKCLLGLWWQLVPAEGKRDSLA